jgi:hypothetical protein
VLAAERRSESSAKDRKADLEENIPVGFSLYSSPTYHLTASGSALANRTYVPKRPISLQFAERNRLNRHTHFTAKVGHFAIQDTIIWAP